MNESYDWAQQMQTPTPETRFRCFCGQPVDCEWMEVRKKKNRKHLEKSKSNKTELYYMT